MENKCPYIEKGVKNGPPILFMAGFPDNEVSGWGDLIPRELEKTYRCIYMCLPVYSKNRVAAHERAWGYDQDEVLDMMEATIEATGLSSGKFTFIAHDWGAFYALLYQTRHPSALSKLILCDVGMLEPANVPIATMPYLLVYQMYFAVVYAISQAISLYLGAVLFRLPKYCMQFMVPTPHDTFHLPEDEFTVRHCYQYYYVWRHVLTGQVKPVTFPTCPLLFMVNSIEKRVFVMTLTLRYEPVNVLAQFGTKKRCMFHDQPFLDRIDATAGCSRYSLPAGHWFQIDEAHATLKLVQEFLNK